MPPAALKPTSRLVWGPLSLMACSMVSAASRVAETSTLPVEVLMKSAPAAMASRLAS
jgi:hypothetical protein